MDIRNKKIAELHAAIKTGSLEKVKALLKEDRSLVNAKDKDGYTPLTRACDRNYKENEFETIIDFLVKKEANINMVDDKMGRTPLHWALAQDAPPRNLIEFLLLADKAPINRHDSRGFTPLHLAAKHANVDVVKMLLDVGANPEETTRHGFTPLVFAVEHKRHETVKLLLQWGAKINIKVPFRPFEEDKQFFPPANESTTLLKQYLIARNAIYHLNRAYDDYATACAKTDAKIDSQLAEPFNVLHDLNNLETDSLKKLETFCTSLKNLEDKIKPTDKPGKELFVKVFKILLIVVASIPTLGIAAAAITLHYRDSRGNAAHFWQTKAQRLKHHIDQAEKVMLKKAP